MHGMFRQQVALSTALGMVLVAGLVACTGSPIASGDSSLEGFSASASETPADTLTSSPSVAFQAASAQATPTPTLLPERPTVRIWWPDELYPQQAGTAQDILDSQFEGFRLAYSAYDLEVRRKRSNGLGGILPMLRTAGPVAPGALPDLTLMRRADMVTAATEGLIYPLTDWVPSDLVGGNLLSGVRTLGEIDGVLFGVPYTLNLDHVVYRTSAVQGPLPSFADVLAQQPRYIFPAGTTPVNWTVLLQYWAAGGRLADQNGSAKLDRDPLLLVLNYYAQGVAKGIFGPSLLSRTQFGDCWTDFMTGTANMIAVDSITYLAHKNSVATNVGLAPVPTVDGSAITALDGWLWVLTTQDTDHQQRARAFLSWMMRISQQSLFTEALGVLPSQQRALQLWDDQAYAGFVQALIPSAQVIPAAQRNNNAAAILQESVSSVLGGTPPDVAADAALEKLKP
jgi:ABC-type glycerol-3-phosphate transport system substrate-binding protein